MRDVVAGSHGFIGSALKKRLEERGFYAGSIDRDLKVPENPNVIWYAASYGNMFDQKDYNLMAKVNTKAVDLLLSEHNPDLFIYFSSSSIYSPKDGPLAEDDPTIPNTDYGFSKMWGEEFCGAHSKNRNVVIVRPFSVTGVGEQPAHLIPTAIQAALNGTELILDPEPVHDYIDIDDLIDGLMKIRDKHYQDEKGLHVYNIGSGKQYTNQAIVSVIELITGKKIPIKYQKGIRPYDKTSWVADTSKLSKLGWKPKISISRSIKNQIETYEQKTS